MGEPRRICSFLPSATEIVYALGLGDRLAGITYECDYPAAARRKPVVVHSRLPHADSSAEIDRQVRAFISSGQSLYRVDMEALERLRPDLILTQDLCHVCAASPGDLQEALGRLPSRPEVLSLSPRNLAEVFVDIRRVGEATGRIEEATRLVAHLEAELRQVEKAVAGADHRPRVLCLEWLDPPFVGGHWVPEMVERAGGHDVLGRAGEPSRRVEWREVLGSQPDVTLVMPCGYDLASTIKEFRAHRFPAAWSTVPAVKGGRVFAVDANSYFSRPGPRLTDGVKILARLVHPERITLTLPTTSVEPV